MVQLLPYREDKHAPLWGEGRVEAAFPLALETGDVRFEGYSRHEFVGPKLPLLTQLGH